jgi:hypothetical protein
VNDLLLGASGCVATQREGAIGLGLKNRPSAGARSANLPNVPGVARMAAALDRPRICFSNQRRNMKTKIALTMALCLVAVAAGFASDANLGTWKLNEAKSKFPAEAAKNTMVAYEVVADSVKVTVDGTDAEGKATHNEWTGKFDGKDYPLAGDPTADTRMYKKINDRTTELTNKKDGKATMSGRIVISADGKSRTLTVSGTDAKGNKFKYTAVYDKQ